MKLFLKKVHLYFYVLVVILGYLLFWPLLYYYYRKNNFKKMSSLRRIWGAATSAFSGFFYRFTYEEPVDWSKTYMICPYHSSNLDISAMCVLVKNTISFIGKEELATGIVTALFFKSVDITVNRNSKISSYKAFVKAAERIKAGITMVIFPEGGIADEYPPQLQSFKNGPFRLAIEHKIPIIPVTSLNAWQLLWDDGTKYGSRPGIAHFYIHKPIETAHLTVADADNLRDEIYRIMGEKLNADKLSVATAG